MPAYLFWVIVLGYGWLAAVGIWTCVRAYRIEQVRMAAWHKRKTQQAETVHNEQKAA